MQHVLVVAGERARLRNETRWGTLMGQVVAARKFNEGAERGGRRDHSRYAMTKLVNSRRARSVSLESCDPDDPRKRGGGTTNADANNAANNAAYARAGCTADYGDEEFEDYDLDSAVDSEELEDDLEEDDVQMAVALETSVRELALGDWARALGL